MTWSEVASMREREAAGPPLACGSAAARRQLCGPVDDAAGMEAHAGLAGDLVDDLAQTAEAAVTHLAQRRAAFGERVPAPRAGIEYLLRREVDVEMIEERLRLRDPAVFEFRLDPIEVFGGLLGARRVSAVSRAPLRLHRAYHQLDQIAELGDEPVVCAAREIIVATDATDPGYEPEAVEAREQREVVDVGLGVSPFVLTKGGCTVGARSQGSRSDRLRRRAGVPIFRRRLPGVGGKLGEPRCP